MKTNSPLCASNHSYMTQKRHHRCNPATVITILTNLMICSIFSPFARSAYGSSLPLEPHQGEGSEQGFFSISSRPTTPMANDGQTGRLAKTIGQMDSDAHHPSGQTQMDSAAPNVETVGAGNQPSFLSVTRLLLSKHIKGCSKVTCP